MGRQKKNEGVTLVAFLLLLIAFIILIAVTILALKGENGLLYTSKEKRIAKDKKEIESIAKLAYNSEIIYTNINGNYLKLHNIIDKVKESGYEIVDVSVTDESAKILEVLLDNEKLTLNPGESQKITLTINKEDIKNNIYFVESRDVYFEINLTSNGVIISDGISYEELQALSKDNDEITLDINGSSVTAQLDGNSINITAIQPGITTINININGTKYATATVEVTKN